MIPAFPKILHVHSTGTEHLYNGTLEITEKLDGSSYSVGRIGGELQMRSKGAIIYQEAPQQMFKGAVDWSLEIQHKIPDNVVIHGEWFMRPKHNALKYERRPKNGFAIFGVRHLPDKFVADYSELEWWAENLECDVVPLLGTGQYKREELVEQIDKFLETESVLGNEKMEGVVIKNYSQTGLIGGMILPILCCKYVREDFKEVNKSNWKKDNPKSVEKLAEAFLSEARWEKAIQYRRDCGELENSPRDIGPLIQRIQQDIREEEQEEIKTKLYNIFEKDIMRIATRGFAQYYKEKLLTDGTN